MHLFIRKKERKEKYGSMQLACIVVCIDLIDLILVWLAATPPYTMVTVGERLWTTATAPSVSTLAFIYLSKQINMAVERSTTPERCMHGHTYSPSFIRGIKKQELSSSMVVSSMSNDLFVVFTRILINFLLRSLFWAFGLRSIE